MSSEIPAALPTQGGNNATPTKDIKESIAALRSILMIDTPTNTLLSGNHPTVAAQQSLNDPTRQHWEELAKLRNKTVELKTKFHAATTEAEHETRQRKTLQTTYDALSKQRKELSVQLDIVAKSRDIAEEKLATMRKSMNEERAAIAHERVQWRPQLEKLKKENETLEIKLKDLEERYLSSNTKVRHLEAMVGQLQNAIANMQSEMESSRQLHIKQVAEQNHAADAEKKLAMLQEELNTIKRRHQKSLGSMLQIQQNLKKQLQQVQLEKKTAEDEMSNVIAELKKAGKAKDDALSNRDKVVEESERKIAWMNEEMLSLIDTLSKFKETKERNEDAIELLKGELESVKEAQTKTEWELNTSRQDLEGREEARKQAEEETRQSKASQKVLQQALEKIEIEMKGLQTKQREARMLPTIDLCEGLPDGMPSSMVALGQLVQGMAETEETDLSFLGQLAEVVHEVKSDFCSLLSKKEFAESRLNTTVATDEKMGYDLASARERLREARDQLMDSREEADRLRSEVASLREELEKRGTKRTLDDHSEVDEGEGQELEYTGSRSKRLSLDDYHGTTDDV